MQQTVNPYHFVTNCISGKWKMTILHHIHHYGKIRFNETKKTLGVSEKVLSQQLKELTHDGLVQRIQYNTIPLKVEYILTAGRGSDSGTGYSLHLEYPPADRLKSSY